MREAQCRSALVLLRNQLHIKARLLLYKKHHVRHQIANTRSRTLINRNEGKIKLRAEKFQAARRALIVLLNGTPPPFPALRKADIRCMEDPDALPSHRSAMLQKESRRVRREADLGTQQLQGESWRVMSWIWTTTG
ncbi:hypothetical protein C8F01DRAFT_945947, partial [Mycena amicta]